MNEKRKEFYENDNSANNEKRLNNLFDYNQINQDDNQINQTNNQINQDDNQINQTNNQINQTNNQINQTNNQINQTERKKDLSMHVNILHSMSNHERNLLMQKIYLEAVSAVQSELKFKDEADKQLKICELADKKLNDYVYKMSLVQN
jgi:septal ring factor EnvC (AmiA/AmiB activator)